MLRLVFVTLCLLPALAQDIADLETALQDATGSERLNILHQLAEAYENTSPRDAVRYGEEGLTLARQLDDPTAIADFLGGLGFNVMNLGDYENALHYQEEALAMRQAMGDTRNAAKSLNNIGIVYYYLGNSEQALSYHFQAMKLREAHQNRAGLAITLNNIGLVYAGAGDLEQAIDYYQRSLIIRQEINDLQGASRVLGNIGAAMEEMARHEEALEYQQRARTLAESINFENGMAYAAYNIGTIFQAMGRNEEALSNHQTAYAHYRQTGDLNGQALTLTAIGNLEAQMGRPQAALTALNQVAILADKIQNPLRIRDAHEALAAIQAARGNYAEALDHYRTFIHQKDILAGEEVRKQMSELSIRYDSEAKAKEIELLKQKNAIQELSLKRQTLQRNSLIIVILAVLFIAAIIVKAHRQNVKNNRLLADKNREIQAAYQRVEVLAKTDPLTGLSNRRDFWDRAQVHLQQYRKDGQTSAILLGDMDHFKTINDRFGHDAGDLVLQDFVQLMRQALRTEDICARWGGEEFIALIPNVDREQASALAERLHQAVKNHRFTFADQDLPVSITIGVSLCTDGNLNSCINAADRALYRGKDQQRNCVIVAE